MPSHPTRAARGRRARATVAGCLLLTTGTVAGCGSGGKYLASAPVDTAATPSAAPTADAVLLGKGMLASAVSLDIKGPTEFVVFRRVIPPGKTVGWHQHEGPETAVLTKGSFTLLRKGACKPVTYHPGQAWYVPANTPHIGRNDGTEPAEFVVTYLLRPGAPYRTDAPAAC
jgi:quercetin dioxygenase-like cupin family protein